MSEVFACDESFAILPKASMEVWWSPGVLTSFEVGDVLVLRRSSMDTDEGYIPVDIQMRT